MQEDQVVAGSLHQSWKLAIFGFKEARLLSSWCWVANTVRAFRSPARCSLTDQAIEGGGAAADLIHKPKERSGLLKNVKVSAIFPMKVDWPVAG